MSFYSVYSHIICFIYIDDFSCPTNMIIQFSELNVLNIELCVCFGLSFCSSFFDMHMLFQICIIVVNICLDSYLMFCHFIYVWFVWNNADVKIFFIIQFHLSIIYWTIVAYHIQYNLVKPPPSVQPDFGDKLSKDRKPKVNSLILNLEWLTVWFWQVYRKWVSSLTI